MFDVLHWHLRTPTGCHVARHLVSKDVRHHFGLTQTLRIVLDPDVAAGTALDIRSA